MKQEADQSDSWISLFGLCEGRSRQLSQETFTLQVCVGQTMLEFTPFLSVSYLPDCKFHLSVCPERSCKPVWIASDLDTEQMQNQYPADSVTNSFCPHVMPLGLKYIFQTEFSMQRNKAKHRLSD